MKEFGGNAVIAVSRQSGAGAKTLLLNGGGRQWRRHLNSSPVVALEHRNDCGAKGTAIEQQCRVRLKS
jgi:hypothetical protein